MAEKENQEQGITSIMGTFNVQILPFFQNCYYLKPIFKTIYNIQILMQEMSSLGLSYIAKHDPQKLLIAFKEFLSNQEIKQCQRACSHLYEFEFRDKFQTKKLLKNQSEVGTFLNWYNKKKKQNIHLKSETEHPIRFQKLDEKDLEHSREVQSFLELQHRKIFQIKYMHAEKKYEPKRWYDKFCSCCSEPWSKTQIILTKEGILESKHNHYVDFLLFSTQFKMRYGLKSTGYQYGIQFSNIHRNILIRLHNWQQFYIFLYFAEIALAKNRRKKFFFKSSSFVRKFNNCDFIIDAEKYYQSVARDIEKAKFSVFICGWWISPEVDLIRPVDSKHRKYRLDNLLLRKAKEGVQIFIIVFNNPPVVPNDANHAQQTLSKLHHNIKVLTHPDYIIPGIWSHHQKAVIVDQQIGYVGGLDLCFGRYDSISHPINSNSSDMYPGIQYNNVRIKEFTDVKNYKKQAVSRNLPRLPWHDVSVRVQGRFVADLSNHFIEYWDNCYLQNLVVESKIQEVNKISRIHQKQKPKKEEENLLIKSSLQEKNSKIEARRKMNSIVKSYNEHQMRDPAYDHHLVLSPVSLGLDKEANQVWEKIRAAHSDQCQLLRSASQWSIGLENGQIEKSIDNAYISLIKKAKHFIYIENQFFISACGSNDPDVQNQIANALYNRIEQAIKKKQHFRVVIFLPLLPGMEGQVDENIPLTLKAILYWQYKTICRDENSLLKRLSKITADPSQYINFYGLRQHGILEKCPVTEIIYMHTKLMIVDDEHVICGSANINDRSLLGDRDSELALFYFQGKKISSKFGNEYTEVNTKAHELRINLYGQHFGLSPEDCKDPLQKNFHDKLMKIAHQNTLAYRELFGCYPDDRIKKLRDTKKFSSIPSAEQYEVKTKNINGHVVEFPLDFLNEQNIQIPAPYFIDDIMT